MLYYSMSHIWPTPLYSCVHLSNTSFSHLHLKSIMGPHTGVRNETQTKHTPGCASKLLMATVIFFSYKKSDSGSNMRNISQNWKEKPFSLFSPLPPPPSPLSRKMYFKKRPDLAHSVIFTAKT